MMSFHPFDKHVGNRIKVLRLKKGVTQADLAKNIGITFQQIQKYESGKNRVSCSRLLQISQCFDMPIMHFLEEFDDAVYKTDQDEKMNELLNQIHNEESQELIAIFSRIKSRNIRQAFVALCKTVKNY